MDKLFELLTQALTKMPPEFLTILVIGVLIGLVFIAKAAIQAGLLKKMLGGKTEEEEEKEKITDTLKDIAEKITTLQKSNDDTLSALKIHAMAFGDVKNEFSEFVSCVKNDLKAVEAQIGSMKTTDEQTYDYLKELNSRINEISSSLSKLDELTRSGVPEFRSYHTTLSKELSNISRDIALVERTIQAQINTINTVKLR